MKSLDVWRWSGTTGRFTFILTGGALLLIKFFIDRFLTWKFFGISWTFWDYFGIFSLGEFATHWKSNPAGCIVLLAASIPFLWIGIGLTLRRLRSAGLPLAMVVLFVIPLIKWFLFLLLALIPPRRESVGPKVGLTTLAGRPVPRGRFASIVISVLVTGALTLLAILFSTEVLKSYGWALFAGIPFVLGFLSVLIHSVHQYRTRAECFTVAIISLLITGGLTLLLALEGAICILMASPLAAAICLLGAYFGFLIQANPKPGQLYCAAFFAMPLMIVVELLAQPPSPIHAVSTSVEIRAPAGAVWNQVVSFTEIPPPQEFLFRAGIAYPVRAEIQGRGKGAIRLCVFSTGAFVEPIEIWDEPKLLRFSVTKNPSPMREWSLFKKVEPPHLNGFLVARQGEFLLSPLPGGKTRLEGTTWYQHGMWPVAYWKLWSDLIIHKIHLRVLNHIKNETEADRR